MPEHSERKMDWRHDLSWSETAVRTGVVGNVASVIVKHLPTLQSRGL